MCDISFTNNIILYDIKKNHCNSRDKTQNKEGESEEYITIKYYKFTKYNSIVVYLK